MPSATPAVEEEDYPLRIGALVIVFLLALAIGVSNSSQVVADTVEFQFPLEDDSWSVTYLPVWSVVGDSVTGNRPIDITGINKVEIHLKLEANTASNQQPHVFDVSLNGKVVGNFRVGRAMGLDIVATIDCPEPVETQDSVVIEYKLVDVDSGGIVMMADGSSTIRLSNGLAPQTKKDFALKALGKLEKLRDSVDQSDIDQGPKRSLLSKLDRAIAKMDQALAKIDQGDEQRANNKLRVAKNSVLSFIKAVDAFSERIAPYGEAWQHDAKTIVELIQRAIETPI